jgi:hypothetical protein
MLVVLREGGDRLCDFYVWIAGIAATTTASTAEVFTIFHIGFVVYVDVVEGVCILG